MKYKIILADPPWSYKVWPKKTDAGRSAASHYQIMDKTDLQNLPVAEIADKDSVLFLWVTPPCLLEGIKLIEKWGFTFKTLGFTWVKRNKIANSWFWGMGYYTRANTELCLLATKGKTLPRVSRSVHQIVDDRVMAHSQKPDSVRDKIVELFGNIPRIELFARDKKPGWEAIGNAIDGRDIRDSLQEIIDK